MITNPKLESSAHGRIELVMLQIPSWVLRYAHQPEIQGTAAVYRDVLSRLNDTVQFLVLTHEESVSQLNALLTNSGVINRADVHTVPNSIKLSVWAQDMFTVCGDDEGRRWALEPASDRREAGMNPAVAALYERGWGRVAVDRRFESGNVLVGDDFWLLGADATWPAREMGVGHTGADKPHGDSSAIVSPEDADHTRRLHVISSRAEVPGLADGFQLRNMGPARPQWRETWHRGNRVGTVQPTFHIDAFITLAGRDTDGRYRVLVGDPGMAAKALGTTLPAHALQYAFDDIAEQLKLLGLAVVRNPLPLVFQDNDITKVRHWYFASTNNAIVEIDGHRRTVWLPSYGHGRWRALEETDELNREIWQQLGFSVRLLTDFHPFAMNLGALRCMAKCLVRGG